MDSEFNDEDSGFRLLDSGSFVCGTWIPDSTSKNYLDSLIRCENLFNLADVIPRERLKSALRQLKVMLRETIRNDDF